MAAGSFTFLGFESFPSEGTLIVPGLLRHREMQALARRLAHRPIVWLVEENAFVEPATRDYLARRDVLAATFSDQDPHPAVVGAALRSKLDAGGLLIFIPGDVVAGHGHACHIPSAQLRFLCELGLPILPLAVHCPEEVALSVESSGESPGAIFAAGRRLDDAGLSAANFRQALLEASEQAFSSRRFLAGSLGESLLRALKTHGRNAGLLDGADDSALPYSQLLPAAIALSREIRTATSRKRVGVILPPGRGGLVGNLAVVLAGKIPVNLNFTASREAVNSAIRQADLDKFLTADPFVRRMPEFPWPPNRDLLFVERLLPAIRARIVRWAIISKLLPAGALARLLGLHQAGRDHDEAILLFTSGSSGEPKGVPLTHRNILANVCQFGAKLDLPPNARILGCLPLFHSFGITVTLWYPLLEGIDLVTYPNPLESKRLAELVNLHHVRLLLSPPTFLRGSMRRVDPAQLAPLELIITGAEKLPQSLAQTFEKKFGILPFEGYGLTETSPATNVNLPDPQTDRTELPALPTHRPGSVGHFLCGIAVRITNPATSAANPLDQSGLIWLKGPNIFPGYLDRHDLTKNILVNGWLKTGDVGHVDDDGFLHIEGRISRFSKIGGEMVPHEAVENAILRVLHLDTRTERLIAVVGVPDDQKGEALVLLSCIASPTLQQEVVDLRYKLMDSGIPSLWCPKRIIPVDEIPVLASGKLDLKTCQRLAQQL